MIIGRSIKIFYDLLEYFFLKAKKVEKALKGFQAIFYFVGIFGIKLIWEKAFITALCDSKFVVIVYLKIFFVDKIMY